MKMKLFVLLLVCLLAGTMGSAFAAGHILLEEEFEGVAAFVDQDWPIKDDTETAASLTPKGANLRTISDTLESPKPSYSNTGTIVPSRFFQGTKALQLASGQMAKATGPIVNAGVGEGRLFQFAVSTNGDTAALPAGTQVGHFKFDWSIVTTDTTEASFVLNFVTNASGAVDVKCQNNNATIGSLTGASGDWLMISLLTNSRVTSAGQAADDGAAWRVYDPFTSTYKGPQPLNPKPIDQMANADFRLIGNGVQIYVNDTNTTVTRVLPDEVGSGWGNSNSNTDGVLNSTEQGWEIAAENGGTLFVDDIYWDQAMHDNFAYAMTQEAGGRMSAFNAVSTEPKEFVASSKTWDLY